MENIDLDQFLDREVDLRKFFREDELQSKSEGEKQRLKNIAQNYEIMIHMGFPAIKPDFMKVPAHRAKKQKDVVEESEVEPIPEKSTSDDSDDETWTPDLERRKRSKEMKKFYPSFSAPKKMKSKIKDDVPKRPVKKQKVEKAENTETVSKKYDLRERSSTNCMVLEVPDDDHFIYCEECNKEYDMDCPVHGPLEHIRDTETSTEFDEDRALHTLPPGLIVKQSSIPNAGLGVFTEKEIPARVMFGPYGGVKCYDQQMAHDSGYCWQIHADGKPSHFVDAQNKANSNWMRYVNCAPSENEQNLVAFQYKGSIYYRSYKVIESGAELLCWYGNEYGRELGLVRDKNLLIRPKLVNGEECFPCVFCKMIFSTVVYNVRHLIKYHGKDKLTQTDVQTLDEWLRENDKEQYFKRRLTKKLKSQKVSSIGNNKHILKQNMHVSVPKQTGSLTNHSTIQSDNKPYKCNVCGYSTTGQTYLKHHMRIHSGEKPYKCDVCGDAFKESGHLKNHMRIHSGEKPYKCDVCGYSTTQNSALKTHMKMHSGEKPYKCDVCGYSTSYSSHLKTHMKIHSGEKPYKCDVCGYSSINSGDLKKHMRIHSGEKPYKCDVCGDAFTQSCHLKTHMRIHSGEKPYKCDVCGDAFTRIGDLKTHMRKHSGEKPYKCDVCGGSFITSSHLKIHMKRKHSDNNKKQISD